MDNQSSLHIHNLYIQLSSKTVLNNINLNLSPKKIIGIVGESGSGKTTLAKAIAGFIPYQKGQIIVNGKQQLKPTRKIQLIPQDPFSSFNPRQKIGYALTQAPIFHQLLSKKDRRTKGYQFLENVGLSSKLYMKYPHEISGGQRQRASIARALAVNPEILICDEIVSMLDVRTQKSILKLLLELKEQHNMGIMFISHDLNVVGSICDYVYVMKEGSIVEEGDIVNIFKNPRHSYTKKLISFI